MISYCLKCRKNTESKNQEVAWTKNRRILLLSKYAVCDSAKSKCVKEEEAGGLLSNLVIKTPLREIPVLVPMLF